MNSTGPTTDPCGTPYLIHMDADVPTPTWKTWVRWSRYDWNQSRAMPSTLKRFSMVSRKIWWSIVSKAALKSNNTRAHNWPPSTDWAISLTTAVTAVSVEWCALYADCRGGSRLYRPKCSLSLDTATRSTNFERKLRFEIGLQDLRSNGSMFVFFMMGLTMADFREFGNSPFVMELLIMAEIAGASRSQHCFTTLVGIGSSWHCLFVAFWMRAVTSSMEQRSKAWNGRIDLVLMTGCGAFAVFCRTASIFSSKKWAKASGECGQVEASVGCNRQFKQILHWRWGELNLIKKIAN